MTTPETPLDLAAIRADWQDWIDLRAAGITDSWHALRMVAALGERMVDALAAVTAERDEARREVRALEDSDDAACAIAEGERDRYRKHWEAAREANTKALEKFAVYEAELAAAREQAKQAQDELARVLAIPGVAVLAAPPCPCRPNEAALHLKDCPVWVNVGPNLARRHYVRRDSLTTPAAAPKADAPKPVGGTVPDDCPCHWMAQYEGETLGLVTRLTKVDQRCPHHGSKPRRAPVPAGGEDGSGTADGNREEPA